MTDFAVPLIPATPAPQGPQDPQRPAWLQRALDDSDREAEKQQRAREQRTLGVFEAAMEESPYDAAALKVAAELTKKQEMLDLYANNPRLRPILDHLPTVRMLHDDLGNLKLVSGSMDWIRRSAEAGAAQNEAGFLKARQALARQNGGSLSAFEMDRLTEIEQMQKMAAADTGPFDTAANILGQMVGPAITATAVGLGSAGVASFGGPISSGAAFVWGSLSAAFTQTAITEFGHEYDKLYSELTEAGVPAEEAHDTAMAMAAGYAVGSAAVETGALGVVGKPFVGAGKKLGAKILGLARPTGERAAAQFLKASALGFGAEVGEEGVQQVLDSFAQNLAGAKHGKDIGPDLAQTLRDAGQAMWQAAKGMAILAPLGPALHYAADLDQVRQAKVNAEGIQQLADAAKAAKMPPDALKKVVDAQAGEGFETVYIEGPRLAQALEATGQTRAQLAHDLPDVAKQLEKAERTGDDVAIPIGDFAAKIARSDLYPAIQKSVRIGKNGWSIDRAEEWEAEREANQAATAKKVAEAAVKFVDWGAQADRVQARIETEIARHLQERQVSGVTKDQVRQYAILHRQHVEARAAEEGKTPEEWDNANKLTFPTAQAVDQPRPAALNQDTAETTNAPDTRASLRGVGREDGGREEARYGTAREGASSVRAVHFSPEPRTTLSGDAYGTGLPGAERRRVTGDPILSKRVHFYVDTGNGVVPEPGVGEHRHVAQLDNVYDTDKDPLGLVAAWKDGPSVDFSDLERAIVDAGFDGIFVPRAQGTQGVAVLLGPKHTAVPVRLERGGTLAQPVEPFYSALANAIGTLNARALTADGWRAELKGLMKKGLVREAEIEATGLEDWLDLQKGKVERQAVLDFLDANGVQVQTVQLGGEDKPTRAEVEAARRALETYSASIPDVMGRTREQGAERQRLLDEFHRLLEESERTEGDAKFAQYQLPGGANYREVLLTLPEGGNVINRLKAVQRRLHAIINLSSAGREGRDAELTAEYDALAAERRDLSGRIPQTFKSTHWDAPNVIAHLRLNDRVDSDGKKVLFVEEIQSDWGQRGRTEGFRLKRVPQFRVVNRVGVLRAEFETEVEARQFMEVNPATGDMLQRLPRTEGQQVFRGVPKAPFVTSTEGWLNLALKKVLQLAVEGDYDKVAFINGEQSAERYNLSKQVDHIDYRRVDGMFKLGVVTTNGDAVDLPKAFYSAEELPDVVGKEVAQKIVNGEGESGGGRMTLRGVALKVGGEGMKAFYDKIVPAVVSKLVRKLGGEQTMVEDIVEGEESTEWRVQTGPDRAQYFATRAEALAKAEALGIPGQVLATKKRNDSPQPGIDLTDELRANVSGGLPLFQDSRGEFDPATNSVFLNPQANATTVLHEMSHFWLTTLFKAAGGLSSSVQTRKDAQTVLDWFGIKDLAAWSALSLEQQRKHHEAWAYNAEAHFFGEGKAPSTDPEQMAMFRKFGRWIRAVYRQVRDKLNARYRTNFGVDLPGLTPDVRAVFDRMVASEDAILAAKAERAGNPLLTEKPADMADQDWANYQEAQRAADDIAVEALQQASLKAMRWTANNGARVARAIQAKTRQARAEIAAQERARAEQEPVYRAIDQLRNGLVREGSTSRGPAFKLNLAGFRATPLGDEARVALLGTGPSGMLSTTGLMPDVAAQLLGFETGEDLVRQLVRALEDAPLDVEVQRRTDARMLAEHSDLTDPQKVQRMIEEAIHNETRTKMVAAELKWLSQVNSPIQLMIRAARAYAQETIGETPVGKVRPHEHAQAEVRERRAAEKALAKGDRAAAASHKRRELIESQMEREALRVREEQEKLEKLLRRVFKADKKLAATRNVDYVAVGRYLASVFGLVDSERAPSSYIEQLKQYNPELFEKLTPQLERAQQWAEQARAEGRVVKTWKDLTVDEFRDLAETIGALWHQALREQQFAVGDEKKDLAEVAKEVTDQAMKLPPGKPTPVGALTPGESRGRGWARIKQLLYRPEHWAWRKDGGDDNGPFTRFFWRTIRAAVDAYGKARTVYTKRIANMVRKLRPGLKQGLIEFRDTSGKLIYVFGRGNGGFGHAELVASLLHVGNLGNLKRLLVGRGWGTYDKETKILDTRNWDAFVSKMAAEGYITKDVMEFVQQLWDLNEELKPIAQKAHRDLYGYYFEEVEAVPVTIPGVGTYRGGYMPAKLDRTARSAARIQNLSALEADFRKQFATTGRGFTRERVEDFAEPLLLDLDLVPAHIDDVLRFSFIQPAVRDVERLAKHTDVATMLDAQQPGVFENMLLPWLQRVASQSITKAGKNEDFDNFWRAVRSSVGISTMFANVGNALQQLTGLISATLKVGPRFLAKGMWRLLGERRDLLKDIASKSAFMANRQNNQVYDSLETITDLMQNRSKFAKLRAWVKQHAYFLQSGMQNLVDSVVWSGAYEQALAKAGKQVNDADADADAIAQADAAVRMTQSSFEPTDVAHFEEGSPFYRIWTMFAGYFNTMANLQADQLVKIGNASGMGKAGVAFGAYALGFALPMLLADAITKTMRGQWEDDDEDGDVDVLTFEYLFLGQLRSALAEVPVFGPTVGAFTLNQFDNEPWNDRMTTSPVVAAFERAFLGTKDSVKTALGLKVDRRGNPVTFQGEDIRDPLTLLGILFRIPLGAVGSRVGYGIDVATGATEASGGLDVARGLLTGVKSRQPK